MQRVPPGVTQSPRGLLHSHTPSLPSPPSLLGILPAAQEARWVSRDLPVQGRKTSPPLRHHGLNCSMLQRNCTLQSPSQRCQGLGRGHVCHWGWE